MKKSISYLSKSLLMLYAFFALSINGFAQNAVPQVTKTEAANWIVNNWIWLVAGLGLLLIIVFSSRGLSKTTTSTTVRRDDGIVSKTTVVENDL